MSVRSKKRALLLVNPKARRGGEALDAVIGRLHTGGLDVTVEPFSALPEIGRDIARLRVTAGPERPIAMRGRKVIPLAA